MEQGSNGAQKQLIKEWTVVGAGSELVLFCGCRRGDLVLYQRLWMTPIYSKSWSTGETCEACETCEKIITQSSTVKWQGLPDRQHWQNGQLQTYLDFYTAMVPVATNLRDMKMGQTWESDEGLLLVISREIVRGKYFWLGIFWTFMSRRFVPCMFTKWCAHSVEYPYYLLIVIVRISTKIAALNYLQVPRLISNDIRGQN